MIELIDTRYSEREFDQTQRFADIEHRIHLFDEDMENIILSRLDVEVAAKFLDVFLLTIYQELWVLRDFKQLEDNLVDNVNDQATEQNGLNVDLTTLKMDIDNHLKNIEQLNLQEKSIQQQFQVAAMGNKFWDFLRKVFKKKFKPPRVIGSDESEESSVLSDESSTEEDDDAESRDSLDIGPVFMDETICPPGCDRQLYDLTFTLRSNRHVVEQKIRDEQAAIENCTVRIDKLKRLRRGGDSILKVRQDELQAFRQVKQKTLNEIDTIVVIRMNQMQHFQNHEEFIDIPNTLLFNNESISNLYARVAQIEFETIQARRRHRANLIHLSRMKTDCKYMEKLIHDLEESYEEEMIKKFGMKVDLDELEEGILRKMVYDIRATTVDIQKEYNTKARELRTEFAKRQEELKCVVMKEIEKLNILTVLQEEYNLLNGLLMQQSGQDVVEIDNTMWEEDLARLTSVANQQKLEIQAIHNEIQMLSSKNKNFLGIAAAENPEFYKCPSQKPLSGHTESEFSYSTYTTTQDGNPISKIVKNFFEKHISQLEPSEQSMLINDVINLFTEAASAFQAIDQNEELQEIVKNFQKLIPLSILSNIAYSEIATLFQAISNVFQNDDVPNPSEMLRCILEETFDSFEDPTRAHSEDFIVQAIKDIIMSLPLDRLMESTVRSQISSTISRMINSRSSEQPTINKAVVVESLIDFAEDNLIDGNRDQLEVSLNSILDDIAENLE